MLPVWPYALQYVVTETSNIKSPNLTERMHNNMILILAVYNRGSFKEQQYVSGLNENESLENIQCYM